MTILLRNSRIIFPGSDLDGLQKDILIENGVIKEIGTDLQVTADQVIQQEGLQVSPGWVDVFASFPDPGYEHKETLESGASAAAAGGFTHVFVMPNTDPVTHTKSQVEYINEKSRSFPVYLHPIGAISKNTEGKELAEMYDMHSSGAIAFGDGKKSVQSAGVMLKALQYVKAFDGVVIQLPDDKSIGAHGLMNEGIVSTRLGLPGKPVMAEEMMVTRDIELAEYADSRLHLTGVTSQKSLHYIKNAKEKGVRISASVTPYHLFFCDEDLQQYDTNLKVNPPLRTREQRDALLAAVKEGLIDCIATHHQPQEWDSKTCEFEYAGFGMIGLETAFGVAGAVGISTSQWVQLCSINPRNIFDLPAATIQVGQPADLTIFNGQTEFEFTQQHIRSKSSNSPFIGKQLKGRVIGIIHKDRLFLND